MEDSKRKPIMIGVAVICLIVAGLITFARRGDGGGGLDSIPDDQMTWVKCANPKCKAEYKMSEKQYIKAIVEKSSNLVMRTTPPLTCEKCGEDSLYKAYKCANPSCGIVFIRGIAGQNDLEDRCPKCGQSEMEEIRKKRLANR